MKLVNILRGVFQKKRTFMRFWAVGRAVYLVSMSYSSQFYHEGVPSVDTVKKIFGVVLGWFEGSGCNETNGNDSHTGCPVIPILC